MDRTEKQQTYKTITIEEWQTSLKEKRLETATGCFASVLLYFLHFKFIWKNTKQSDLYLNVCSQNKKNI